MLQAGVLVLGLHTLDGGKFSRIMRAGSGEVYGGQGHGLGQLVGQIAPLTKSKRRTEIARPNEVLPSNFRSTGHRHVTQTKDTEMELVDTLSRIGGVEQIALTERQTETIAKAAGRAGRMRILQDISDSARTCSGDLCGRHDNQPGDDVKELANAG